ncbi:molybdopterin-dependent oxidoreductase [Rhodobaculum claviforme]|uniref:Oxidoreductase molybdopterin-binding domain-containing protein n=1 Tax=Rhodobaculum claviforme TaxID=1549854 RepID=A0A934WHL7_9RHOB|nr:molybdopterin-dependent oxidoreductase [Rhodobaculum claviforme]MBK5927315.1 hypothetical protein [Rhodobaculum claviforme]
MTERIGLGRRRCCLGLIAAALGCAMIGGHATAGERSAQTASFLLRDSATAAARRIDIAALRTMPQTTYVTGTVWTDAVHRYTGVLLRDLLLHAGIDGGAGAVTVLALDSYRATLDFTEITGVAPMLAFLRDGAEMPLRAQGPFWLIYPFDEVPAFQTETTYARSVWQVSHLLVER